MPLRAELIDQTNCGSISASTQLGHLHGSPIRWAEQWEDGMSYEDIRIEGSLAQAMETWVGRRYGRVVDIEMGGVSEGDYAAVGYAAVEDPEAGTVDAVVLMLQHDPEGGPDQYRIKDMAESEGPVLDLCPERILNLLTQTEDDFSNDWRERCREKAAHTRSSAPLH